MVLKIVVVFESLVVFCVRGDLGSLSGIPRRLWNWNLKIGDLDDLYFIEQNSVDQVPSNNTFGILLLRHDNKESEMSTLLSDRLQGSTKPRYPGHRNMLSYGHTLSK